MAESYERKEWRTMIRRKKNVERKCRSKMDLRKLSVFAQNEKFIKQFDHPVRQMHRRPPSQSYEE